MDTAPSIGRTPDDRLPDQPGADGPDARTVGPEAPADPPGAADPEHVRREVVSTAIRSQRSTRDIVLSLVVLLVPIALLIGFGRVFLGADTPTEIDPAPTVQLARAANVFPVSEATGLGDGWRTVSADFRRGDTGATLRIGYLSPDDDGLQLVQSNVPAEELIPAELTRAGQPQGTVEIAGRGWQRYTARAGELALVLLEPGRTVIVVGQAPEEDLRHLAASLT
ncbi:DUF4245 domain-containing protein [Micromonospora sp. HM5-17]|uniref:DUF4245 domain-containing protein n=1 Tax=Micromonospora sp. HM5-17 TaxID=2487710 RepID=UPI000F4ADE7B|nr:DUF4245 domain-containing protein [Micromonospora sp. HM5-17]ROT32149.1 DUF4245 domain-containing protein [Micromonospora sp. HM5-17]